MIKKKSLLNRLVSSSTAVIVFSLVFSGLASYLTVKRKTTEDLKDSAVQLLNQNMNYINFVADTVDSKSMEFLANDTFIKLVTSKYDNDYERLQAQNTVQTIIKNVPLSNYGLIKSVYFFNDNGFSYASDSSSISEEKLSEMQKTDWYKKVTELNGSSLWIPPHINTLPSSEETVITNARMIKTTYGTESCGIITININPEIFNSALKNTKLGKNGYIFIVDKNGFILSHKNSKLMGKKLDPALFSKIKNKNGTINDYKESNQKMYGVYTTANSTGWKFIALVPQSELSSAAKGTGLMFFIIILIFIVISVFISFITTRQITKPIYGIIDITKELSNGNFNVKCCSQKLIELDALSLNFNNMIANLKDMLFTTKNLAQDTNTVSNKLLSLSQQMNVSAGEINTAIEEIASNSSVQTEDTLSCVNTTDNFNSEINKSIEFLGTVNSGLKNTIDIIDESSNIINSLKNTSNNNSSAMSDVKNTIQTLSENSKDILSILEKINKITEQTNLLSLNASIEAARAGESGKGFSVVANEIRKLAEESQKASLDIKNITNNIDNSLCSALSISSKAQSAFNKELSQVSKTTESFDSIKESAGKVIEKMNETMNSIKILINQKNILFNSINNISEISQKNTAASEEVTAAVQEQTSSNSEMNKLSQSMAEKASKLKEAIEKFKF